MPAKGTLPWVPHDTPPQNISPPRLRVPVSLPSQGIRTLDAQNEQSGGDHVLELHLPALGTLPVIRYLRTGSGLVPPSPVVKTVTQSQTSDRGAMPAGLGSAQLGVGGGVQVRSVLLTV